MQVLHCLVSSFHFAITNGASSSDCNACDIQRCVGFKLPGPILHCLGGCCSASICCIACSPPFLSFHTCAQSMRCVSRCSALRWQLYTLCMNAFCLVPCLALSAGWNFLLGPGSLPLVGSVHCIWSPGCLSQDHLHPLQPAVCPSPRG